MNLGWLRAGLVQALQEDRGARAQTGPRPRGAQPAQLALFELPAPKERPLTAPYWKKEYRR